MADTDQTTPVPPDVLTTFATLWSIASLFHIASYDHWDRGMLIVVAVVWLLLKPSSAGRLALVAASQLTVALVFAPFISNHWLFTAFVNAGIVASWAALAIRERSVHVEGPALYRMFAPTARWMVVVLYFYVVFHKLNADFFSLETSCGTDFYAHHLQRFPFLPEADWVSWSVIWGTVLVEAAIPILFVFRKTRHWGVMLGMAFHGMIAFNPKNPFYNFSSMLYAAYTLFLPPDFQKRLSTKTRRVTRIGVAATVAALALTMFDPEAFDGPLYVWAPYALSVMVVVFIALGPRLGDAPQSPRELFAFRRWWLAILPLVLFANGFMPYLGLKTETSFAMYSNLRTERGESNHFLVGKWTEFTDDYQYDFVKIVESNNPVLQKMADLDLLVPWFELRRIGSELQDTSVTYVRDGETVVVDRTGDDPELSKKIPLWKQKLLYFRPIDDAPHQTCHH